MISSGHKKSLKLWWRRQRFNFRRYFVRKIILILILILLISRIPAPWSYEYEQISIDQKIEWNDVHDLVELKAKLFEKNPSKIILNHTDFDTPSNVKVILLYTTVFRSLKYCYFPTSKIFGESCPSKDRCRWSCDRRDLSIADAIIFHGYDIQYFGSSLPERSQCKKDVVWILWSDEPRTIINYSLFNVHQFNWTISYKLTSEVSIGTYGLFKKRFQTLTDEENDRWIEKNFFQRSSGAVWFVSNCDSKERLNYFQQLKKVSRLPIEGYGRCVDYYPFHWCQRYSVCEKNFMSNFKFYLSFESITCEDYVTEKFYKAFFYGLIPIVYGPKREDYEKFAPKQSFIHLDDFNRNLTELSLYLEKIFYDKKFFSRFHQWRKHFEVIIDPRALDKIRMCELCQRLNEIQKFRTFYNNIEQFYDQGCEQN